MKPLQALEKVSELSPAVLFLDIDMPDINGLEFADLLHNEIMIVYSTAYRQYAPEAFEKDAKDYLLKPISYDRFLNSIQKLRRTQIPIDTSLSNYSAFFVKTGIKGKMVKIEISEILFISSALNYVEIHLWKNKVITYLTLEEILNELPSKSFSRVHKSYVVNHDMIQSIEFNQLQLKNETIIPVGRAFQQSFRKKLQTCFLISKRDPSK